MTWGWGDFVMFFEWLDQIISWWWVFDHLINGFVCYKYHLEDDQLNLKLIIMTGGLWLVLSFSSSNVFPAYAIATAAAAAWFVEEFIKNHWVFVQHGNAAWGCGREMRTRNIHAPTRQKSTFDYSPKKWLPKSFQLLHFFPSPAVIVNLVHRPSPEILH